VLAQTIYQLAKNLTAPPVNFALNCTPGSFADQLAYCLTKDMGCALARHYFHTENTDYETQPTAYTGVFKSNSVISESGIFIYKALVQAVGDQLPLQCTDYKECGAGDCIFGFCYTSEVHWHNALSLAFDLSSGTPVDQYWETESTWTESRWNTPYLQMFEIDNPVVDIVTFVFGLLFCIASFLIVWFLRRYFSKRFKSI